MMAKFIELLKNKERVMKWKAAIFLSLLLNMTLSGWAQAGEIAYTVRATELKARPFSDAATLGRLMQRTKVEVVARRSSWMQVQVDGKTGWVKMLSLKFNQASNKAGSSGLATLFNVASSGGSSRSATTGVRGLSEKDLKNTKPNPRAFAVMQTYAVNKSEAKQFASAGKLNSQSVGYLAESASGGAR